VEGLVRFNDVFVILQGFNHHADYVVNCNLVGLVILKLILVVDGAVQRRIQASDGEFFLCMVSETVVVWVQVRREGPLVTPAELATFEEIRVLAGGVATNFAGTHPFENRVPLFAIVATTTFRHLILFRTTPFHQIIAALQRLLLATNIVLRVPHLETLAFTRIPSAKQLPFVIGSTSRFGLPLTNPVLAANGVRHVSIAIKFVLLRFIVDPKCRIFIRKRR